MTLDKIDARHMKMGVLLKDTSTIPFSGGNDSKLVKYSDKRH